MILPGVSAHFFIFQETVTSKGIVQIVFGWQL